MRTAQIDPSAEFSLDIEIGEFVVIAANVKIAAGCRIGHHVVIHQGTEIGPGTVIGDQAVLGKLPQLAKNSTTTDRCQLPSRNRGYHIRGYLYR
jgi:acyl-[acyl carrier protein]--UDP-N-acetylglucosamine O-acyltransferase